MNPLASLSYCLSRHTLATDRARAINLARGAGMGEPHVYHRDVQYHAEAVECAAMGSRPSVDGHLSTADPTSTAEEVTLQVLAVCLRWRCDGRTRNDGKDDTSSPRAQAAHRHAERLIERSVLRRERC